MQGHMMLFNYAMSHPESHPGSTTFRPHQRVRDAIPPKPGADTSSATAGGFRVIEGALSFAPITGSRA